MKVPRRRRDTHPQTAQRHLRLVTGEDAPDRARSPQQLAGTSTALVILAGADVDRRRALRSELADTMTSTLFVEASEAWEVIQRAPCSRMVVLAGDLTEISAAAITRLLGRRYPGLPVLTLDEGPSAIGGAAAVQATHSAHRAV